MRPSGAHPPTRPVSGEASDILVGEIAGNNGQRDMKFTGKLPCQPAHQLAPSLGRRPGADQ